MKHDRNQTDRDERTQPDGAGASPALSKGGFAVREYVDRLLAKCIKAGWLDENLEITMPHVPAPPCLN